MADRKISDLTALTAPAAGDYLPIVDISEVAAASKNKRITIEELFRGTPDGTAAAPAIAPESDPNTGIYSSGADQLSIATNGTERLRIDSAGQIEAVSLGTAAAPTFSFTGDPNTGIYSPGADQLAISTNGAGRLFVDSSGAVGIGLASDNSAYRLNVYNPSADFCAVSIGNNVSGGGASNGLVIAQNQADALFINRENGYAAFSTNNTERMRITAAGLVGLGTSSVSNLFHIKENAPTAYAVMRMEGNGRGGEIDFYNGATAQAAIWGNSSTLNFGTGASFTQAMIIDASQRVGIGTTSPSAALHVASSEIRVEPTTTTASAFGRYVNTAGQVFFGLDNSGGTTFGSAYAAHILHTGAYPIVFSTNSQQRAQIDSSGRLLVGTSTSTSVAGAAALVQIETGANLGLSLLRRGDVPILALAATGGSGATVVTNGQQLGQLRFAGADGSSINVNAAQITCEVDGTPGTNDMPGRLVFSTTADGASSPTERMRITNDGKIYVNTTSAIGGSGAFLHVNATNNAAIFKGSTANQDVINTWNAATSGDNIFVNLGTEASFTSRGTIDYNRAAGQVRYNVTSDRRLKSDIQPAASALDSLSALQVRAYKWTETDYQVHYGFIAQELNEIVPDAVKVGDDGEEVTDAWSVDTGKLVPLLTKALQEAMERIETLEAKVAALEAQ